MGFVHDSNVNGRVRVKRRIVSEPDQRGRKQLLARKGEEISVREALARGIALGHLEPVGQAGAVAIAGLRKAKAAKAAEDREQALEEVRQQLDDASRASQQAAEQERADNARGQETTWPAERGGGRWMLSDGTVIGPMEQAEAVKAQQALDAATGDGPASDKVDDVKAWVGDDVDRARQALAAEQAKDDKDQRSSLVEHLTKLLEEVS